MMIRMDSEEIYLRMNTPYGIVIIVIIVKLRREKKGRAGSKRNLVILSTFPSNYLNCYQQSLVTP